MLSVVVPLYNEEANVEPLIEAVRNALNDLWDWELVLVDDGSSDRTVEVAAAAAVVDRRIRVVRLARNFGQTPAMRAGFDAARGDVVVSMDGDLQNDPRDIPNLLERLNEGYDLVAGYRVNRQDNIIRVIPSWIANRMIHWITGVAIRDNGCSLKAYRRGLLERLPLYSDMHRFIPAVASGLAGARIAEVPVRHHPRRFGTSKYGMSRILKVLADVVTIRMIQRFRERPLVVFGLAAVVVFVVALAFMALTAFALIQSDSRVSLVYPSVALLLAGLAMYLVMLGLTGEVMVRRTRLKSIGPVPLIREGRTNYPAAGGDA